MALTNDQRVHLENRLREERSRALTMLDRTSSSYAAEGNDEAGDISTMPTHAADLGTDTMQSELSASNATRVSLELAEIDAALTRLYKEPEKFGVCENTGANIPMARLEVIPWARTCE